jgi:hypothetical protein
VKILHIAPHFGGGIAPAVVGISEAINATHKLIEIEKTKDATSLKLLNLNKLIPECINRFTDLNEVTNGTDLVIFHYWETGIWSDLIKYNLSISTKSSALLNHQAFSFNGSKIQQIGNLFNFIIQSGYNYDQIPSGWDIVPTCNTKPRVSNHNALRSPNAVYLGTLAYKKVDKNFFKLATKLNDRGITLDIYGKESDSIFFNDMKINQSANLLFQGYTSNSSNVLRNYTYFFYPLRSDHYGTTENSLLEAMSEGLIPLVRNNLTEKKIIGNDLIDILDIEKCLNLKKSPLFDELNFIRNLSTILRSRALSLTSLSIRQAKWELILARIKPNAINMDLTLIAQQIIRGI